MISIDCIYIININKSLEYLQSKLINFPILFSNNTKVEYFSGINGWDLVNGDLKDFSTNYKVSKWWKIPSNNPWYNRDLTPGEIGCGLSHYTCLQDAYFKKYNNILILEEDFLITEPFPFKEVLEDVPKEWSLIYLGRKKNWNELNELKVGEHLYKVGYSYLAHANLYSSKGIKEILNSSYITNLIPWDEFLPAINGTTNRRDAIKHFHNPNFLALGFNENYIIQTSSWLTLSSTENNLKLNK